MRYLDGPPTRLELLVAIIIIVMLVIYARPPTNEEIKKECEYKVEKLERRIDIMEELININAFTLLIHNKAQKRIESVIDEYVRVEADIKKIRSLSQRVYDLTDLENQVCEFSEE